MIKIFAESNAIKYLARYGKKNGKNRKDLLKAVHYVILLMSSEDEELIKQQTDPSQPMGCERCFKREDTIMAKVETDVYTFKDDVSKAYTERKNIIHLLLNKMY